MLARWIAAAALGLAATACGGDQNGAAPPQPDGHRRMLALLREIDARAIHDNVFFGDAAMRKAEAELQRLGAAAPWQVHRDHGEALVRLGREREGIDELELCLQQVAAGTLAGGADAAAALHFQLGVAWLRLGETQNCCETPVAESCIVPLAGDAVHRHPEGSKRAVAHFEAVLAVIPPSDYWHFANRWLLNLAHMTLGTWPAGVAAPWRLPTSAFETAVPFPRFPNVAARVGLDTVGLAGGIVVDDFDGDDDLDVLASDWHTHGQLRLFSNGGDGTFTDVTEAAGLLGLWGGLNLVQADWDNDGDLDFLVLRGAWMFEQGRMPKSLVRNNGNGTFTDVTFDAGLGAADWPSQAGAFADYDNDGDLDLYIGNECSSRVRCASQLFQNQGDGTFTEVAAAAGVENSAYAKGVDWGDVDGDRYPDLYVSNIDGDNRLYRNRRDGTFEDVAAARGVTRPSASFPCWFWDFDNDGALDLWVGNYNTGVGHIAAHVLGANLPHDRSCLYRGDGRGNFRDVAVEMGLGYPAMPMGCNFGDLDGDGWLDFYLGTGNPEIYSLMPNLMYRNDGGRRFVDVTMAGGFGHLQKGHGVAFADFDHDGDCDVFAQMGGAYPGDRFADALFLNPGFGNRWLTVHLVGKTSNRSALGARIRVVVEQAGVERSIYRHVDSGGSFGCNPLRQTIGLGAAERIVAVEIDWPTTGKQQRFSGIALDAAVRIVEDQDAPVLLPLRRMPLGAPTGPR